MIYRQLNGQLLYMVESEWAGRGSGYSTCDSSDTPGRWGLNHPQALFELEAQHITPVPLLLALLDHSLLLRVLLGPSVLSTQSPRPSITAAVEVKVGLKIEHPEVYTIISAYGSTVMSPGDLSRSSFSSVAPLEAISGLGYGALSKSEREH